MCVYGGVGGLNGGFVASPLAYMLHICYGCGLCCWGSNAGGRARCECRIASGGQPRGVNAMRCITEWITQCPSEPVSTLAECHIACTLAKSQSLQVLVS